LIHFSASAYPSIARTAGRDHHGLEVPSLQRGCNESSLCTRKNCILFVADFDRVCPQPYRLAITASRRPRWSIRSASAAGHSRRVRRTIQPTPVQYRVPRRRPGSKLCFGIAQRRLRHLRDLHHTRIATIGR
jgi:hypothetical protein